MLQSLPHEIKAQIAGHLLTDSRQSLFNLALCSHLLLRAALPLLWKTPRLSPLATPASWQRFLDAVAASHLGKTCFDYASWIQGVDDLGLFVGGEDEVDDSLEQRDVCSYAYPPETESDQTATQPNVSVVDALLERKDSKIEDVKTNEASPPEQAEEDHDLKIVQNEFSDLGLELEFTLDQPAPKARVRRQYLLKPSSTTYLSELLPDSIHYALALLFTHCENIRSVNLQLPLPIPKPGQLFAVNLALLPNLQKLEISTRITNQILQSIFTATNHQHRLKHLLFTRLEVSDEVLELHLVSSLHPEALETLQLPSTAPASSQNASSYFFQHSSSRRPARYGGSSRDPPPQLTYPGILPILRTFQNLKVLDISAAKSPPISFNNHHHSNINGFHENQHSTNNDDDAVVVDDNNQNAHASPVLETLATLTLLRKLTLSLSRASGITVPELSRIVISRMPKLRKLTLKATVGTDDYTGDSTVEEEDVIEVPLFWGRTVEEEDREEDNKYVSDAFRIKRTLVLVGLDFVKGGEGVMRSYYSCKGGDLGMVAEFRMRWEAVHGDFWGLSIQNW